MTKVFFIFLLCILTFGCAKNSFYLDAEAIDHNQRKYAFVWKNAVEAGSLDSARYADLVAEYMTKQGYKRVPKEQAELLILIHKDIQSEKNISAHDGRIYTNKTYSKNLTFGAVTKESLDRGKPAKVFLFNAVSQGESADLFEVSKRMLESAYQYIGKTFKGHINYK